MSEGIGEPDAHPARGDHRHVHRTDINDRTPGMRNRDRRIQAATDGTLCRGLLARWLLSRQDARHLTI